MTLIERINALITSIGADIKALANNKVDKTATIGIANGGTGGTDVATARTNLGLGTAATATVTTSKTDSTIGRVIKVGDFGFGNGISISEDWNDKSSTKKYNALSSQTLNFVSMGNVGSVAYGRAIVSYLSRYFTGRPDSLWGIAFGLTLDKEFYRIFSDQDQTTGLYTETIYTIIDTGNSYKYNIAFNSVKSGAASYKKGWRKLSATLPSAVGEVTLAHGVTTVETVQAKVTNSDGVIIYNNDLDPTNQFYVRVNGANLVLGVTANSTKVFGKVVTIYVGEEL